MAASQRKATKKSKPATAARSAKSASEAAPVVDSKANLKIEAAQNRFAADVRTRQESAPLKDGKLPLGKTHIEQGKGLPPKRARYTLTG
jgi:hypothetical protein